MSCRQEKTGNDKIQTALKGTLTFLFQFSHVNTQFNGYCLSDTQAGCNGSETTDRGFITQKIVVTELHYWRNGAVGNRYNLCPLFMGQLCCLKRFFGIGRKGKYYECIILLNIIYLLVEQPPTPSRR